MIPGKRFGTAVGVLVLLFCVSLTPRARGAEPIPHGQGQPPNPPRSAQEAAAMMTVPPGFTVEVVASEPEIVNPVAMTFDERGRIWITESLEYPRHSAGPGKDRVKVLEDTDGDGKADRFTVFADGLNIPSGIAVGHGGVWVANAPDILFLKDTNGDGKADTREVVVTGFGRDDTHELPNSLTWGPDGWLYGWNGVFNHSHIKYRGKDYDFTCAIFRIHPQTRAFELFCEGTSNPWGIAWNPDGEAFASACVIDHLWHLTETGYYHRQGGPYPPFTWKIESIVDHRHQQAAYCGIHDFDSDAYPPEFRDKLYMGNIHGNCINVDKLERNGSTYKGIAQPDFLKANDAWFMPVVVKTGPDGCLYVLDWYDRYHCYQDANRDPAGIDRLKGRLYRVRYKNTPRAPKFDMARESDAQVVERLKSPNVYYRDIAQRLLIERNSPATRTLLQALVHEEQGERKARLHALWSLIGGGPLPGGFHEWLLDQPDPTFRAWGVRAAGNMRSVEGPIRQAVVALAHDPDPTVALQVAIAAKKIAGIEPFPVWLDILSTHGGDRLIPQIVWQNMHPMLEEQGETFARLATRDALKKSPGLARLMPRVIERLLGRKQVTAAPIVALLKTMVAVETPATIEAARQTMNALAAEIQSDEIAGPNLEALRASLRPIVAPFLQQADHALHPAASLLAASWGDPAAVESVRALFRSVQQPFELRIQALNALIAVEDDALLDPVAEALALRHTSREFRGQVLAALGRLDDPRVAEVVLNHYADLEPDLQPKAVELLTQRTAWALALLEAVREGKISANALNVNQLRKLLGSKDATLVKLVKAQWGTVREGRNPAREQVMGEVRALLRKTPGDPKAGQLVFKRVCAQCHKIYGEGQDVGPEITLNGRGSYEQLLSNILDPSLVIGAAYQATTVATTDGRVLTGLLVEDAPQRIVLKTPGGKLETIGRKDVEERKISPLSLMPEDLEKQLQPQEIADLFAFITLDKPPTDPDAHPIPGADELRRRK